MPTKRVNIVYSAIFGNLQRSIGLSIERGPTMTGHDLETINPVSASNNEPGDDFSSSSVWILVSLDEQITRAYSLLGAAYQDRIHCRREFRPSSQRAEMSSPRKRIQCRQLSCRGKRELGS